MGENLTIGFYIIELVYEVMLSSIQDYRVNWWCMKVSRISTPLKYNIFLWMELSNKLLTWDNLINHFFKGLGKCLLCRVG